MDEILFYVTQSLEALQVQKQFTEFCWELFCIVVVYRQVEHLSVRKWEI